MKNISKLYITFLVAGLMFSCKKNVSTIYYEGNTDPVLTANRSNNISLAFATKDQEAINLSWTNPDYRFSTGTSSQSVSYKVEIDTVGANFTNPSRKVIGLSADLALSINQSDMNDYLLNAMNLVAGISHNIEIRVIASLPNNALPVVSNALQFSVTPYAIPPKVNPPSSDKLFIVGNATPGGDATGWNNPVPVPQQEFTRLSPTLYTITIALNGGKSYLLLPVNGSWDAKYGGAGSGNNSNNPNEDDFKAQGSDLLSPSVSGTYKIDVDFQRGRFKLTKL